MPKTTKSVLHRAIRVERGDAPPLFQLALPLNDLLAIADVSRVEGATLEELVHYKRPEVRKAVDKLAQIAKNANAPFPYPITIALSSRVRFRQSRGPAVGAGTSLPGTLEIPCDKPATKKPALVVDGHFALLAACKANVADLPLPVVAFVCDDELRLREQFRSLAAQRRLAPEQADQLVPEVLVSTSPKLSAREVPAVVGQWLNESEKSPFHGLVKGSTRSVPKQKAIVPAAALTRMVDESLSAPSGCLFPYRNIATGETDLEGICRVLMLFWNGVKSVFPEAWGKPPARSRLMYTAGIRSMGRLMDRIMPTISLDDEDATAQITAEIQKVAPVCRWTSGTWEELDLKWNEVQSVPRHVHLLSNLLIRTYAGAQRPSKK